MRKMKEYLLSALKIEALICEPFQFDLGRLVAKVRFNLVFKL